MARGAEGLDMPVETVPGFPKAPRWLLNESLVTWKCFQYKVWHRPVEPRERIGPFTQGCPLLEVRVSIRTPAKPAPLCEGIVP